MRHDQTNISSSPARGMLLPAVAVAAWLAVSGAGMWIVLAHEFRQGLAASAPTAWPEKSVIERVKDRVTLVMLAHPHCPCTKASLDELSAIIARGKDLIDAHVLFIRPEGVSSDWTRTENWRKAEAIPGVHLLVDEKDAEARLFGAKTSGQVIVYDREGRLAFSGGITPSRAHTGDSEGVEAILSIARNGAAARPATAVFGCPLFGPRPARAERSEPCRS